MTTSGTTAVNFQIREIIEEAFDRAGRPMRSGYDLKSARRSLDLMCMEWVSRGLNLFTVEEGTLSLVANTATYDLPNDTVDLIEMFVRTQTGSQQIDTPITRMSVSTYAAQVTKTTSSQPLQAYISRNTTTPTITFWPVPDTAYDFRYYRMRRIQDMGAYSNTPDVPFRFVPALVAGLAFQLAMKDPTLMDRVAPLKLYYEEVMKIAEDEDRDRSSLFIAPWVEP